MAKESLVLTGFMGVGKSTAGSKAADILDVAYYDTDTWMETNAGINVPQLVKTDMVAFRKLEAETLEHILQQEPGIISTGGGIVSTEIGRRALRASHTPIVWLRASFDDSAARVADDTGRERPLFYDRDTARRLYEERIGWYEETADYTIDAAQPVDLVVDTLVRIARLQ